MESRFPHPCKECEGVGSPGGQIPEPLCGCLDNADANTGNPDVRVLGMIKTDDWDSRAWKFQLRKTLEQEGEETKTKTEEKRNEGGQRTLSRAVSRTLQQRRRLQKVKNSATSQEGRGCTRRRGPATNKDGHLELELREAWGSDRGRGAPDVAVFIFFAQEPPHVMEPAPGGAVA
ncbi:hypothetical protein NDU88_002120 [Pleurodeles waltl]|uniref:Uncharacterized protein n=1 Tax=Pleurodeles waltl TaxID=8319 RepID=A0AAV7P8I8_PLEWA|nr:hypothetical protein NDU88_002120 [Pleurodeles waltl]